MQRYSLNIIHTLVKRLEPSVIGTECHAMLIQSIEQLGTGIRSSDSKLDAKPIREYLRSIGIRTQFTVALNLVENEERFMFALSKKQTAPEVIKQLIKLFGSPTYAYTDHFYTAKFLVSTEANILGAITIHRCKQDRDRAYVELVNYSQGAVVHERRVEDKPVISEDLHRVLFTADNPDQRSPIRSSHESIPYARTDDTADENGVFKHF